MQYYAINQGIHMSEAFITKNRKRLFGFLTGWIIDLSDMQVIQAGPTVHVRGYVDPDHPIYGLLLRAIN